MKTYFARLWAAICGRSYDVPRSKRDRAEPLMGHFASGSLGFGPHDDMVDALRYALDREFSIPKDAEIVDVSVSHTPKGVYDDTWPHA